MSITFFGFAFDARDAAELAAFWSAVLDRPVEPGAGREHAVIAAGSEDHAPRLAFHRVPEPKAAKNRFHPDLVSTTHDDDVSRLLRLGATVVNRVESGSARWTTLADPDGNEFDLIVG